MNTASRTDALLALMTAADLSEYLGVPPGTLANWRYQGRGPAFVRLGRHVRYRADDVLEWINGRVSKGRRVELDPAHHHRVRSARR